MNDIEKYNLVRREDGRLYDQNGEFVPEFKYDRDGNPCEPTVDMPYWLELKERQRLGMDTADWTIPTPGFEGQNNAGKLNLPHLGGAPKLENDVVENVKLKRELSEVNRKHEQLSNAIYGIAETTQTLLKEIQRRDLEAEKQRNEEEYMRRQQQEAFTNMKDSNLPKAVVDKFQKRFDKEDLDVIDIIENDKYKASNWGIRRVLRTIEKGLKFVIKLLFAAIPVTEIVNIAVNTIEVIPQTIVQTVTHCVSVIRRWLLPALSMSIGMYIVVAGIIMIGDYYYGGKVKRALEKAEYLYAKEDKYENYYKPEREVFNNIPQSNTYQNGYNMSYPQYDQNMYNGYAANYDNSNYYNYNSYSAPVQQPVYYNVPNYGYQG